MKIRCGGCDTTWTGVARAHCSKCHLTFSAGYSFDQHLRNGKHLDPAEAGFKSETHSFGLVWTAQ